MYSKGAPRRRHSEELKALILGACAEPGASVAQAHGLNANLLHKWRRGPARVPLSNARPYARHCLPSRLAVPCGKSVPRSTSCSSAASHRRAGQKAILG